MTSAAAPETRNAEANAEAAPVLARQAAGTPTRQARALDAEAVAAIRGALNGTVEDDLRIAVTMALVSVLSDGGLRRSEAAALAWDDVERQADGSGRVTIRQSKTDAEGEGAVVAITARAMANLQVAFLRGNRVGKVFGIGPQQIARRIKAAARKAGLGDGFSGHSGRVGTAIRMTRAGAPTVAVMRQGRWASARMVARYTRKEAASLQARRLRTRTRARLWPGVGAPTRSRRSRRSLPYPARSERRREAAP